MPNSISDDGEGTAAVGDAAADTGRELAPTESAEQALLLSPISGLVLAGIAAFLVWSVLEAVLPVFELPPHLRELSGNAPEAKQKELMAATRATANKNATFALAVLAGTLGLFLVAADAMQRKQGLRVVWGGLAAASISAGFAIGGGTLGGVLGTSSLLPEDPLMSTIVLHAVTLGVAGMGVGLGVAVAATLPKVCPPLLGTCLFSGMLGGLLGGLVYPLAASVLLPHARTEVALPDPGTSRLLWLALGAIAIAATITGMGNKKNEQDVTAQT